MEETKTGLLAIPVLCGSLSYIITASFGWNRGLDKKFQQAKVFYIIAGMFLILGLFINYVKILPIKALLWSAILYGLTPPVLIAIILYIANNKEVMGYFTNNSFSNFMGFTVLILMSIVALVLIYLQILA